MIKNIIRGSATGYVAAPDSPESLLQRWQGKAALRMLTKKPVIPSAQEIEENPRARSAKLWVAEKPSS
jgi:16S rRNA (cytosine1402-N4)-methyltransferase